MKRRKDAKIVRDARTIKRRAVDGVIVVAILLAAWFLTKESMTLWPGP
jgi:hypothetical protein